MDRRIVLATAPHDHYYAQLQQRLVRYAQMDTASDESSNTSPSTARQWTLLHALDAELARLGVGDRYLSPTGFLLCRLAASSGCSSAPTIVLVAHVDTSPEAPSDAISPQVHTNYDGGELHLAHATLSPATYPELSQFVGHTLISSTGRTLLGADDKCGVAILVTLVERLLQESDRKHGVIELLFTTDEEVGRGLEGVDTSLLQAQYGYTLDGGMQGEFEYECFHAASLHLSARGLNAHPGSALGVMRHATEALVRIDAQLGYTERPWRTQGREGFLHLLSLTGDVSQGEAHYIIRDHDRRALEARLARMVSVIEAEQAQPLAPELSYEIHYQYNNMYDYIASYPEVIDLALAAFEDAGVVPLVHPIRGGTDGAELSRRGIPCPNIFAGGMNFHSPHEYCSVDSMRHALEVVTRIAERYVDYARISESYIAEP